MPRFANCIETNRSVWSWTRPTISTGFHHYRFFSGDVSLGAVPPAQECGQGAYSARSARQHSDQCLCDQQRGTRRPHSRPTAARSIGALSARPRILGLRPALRAQAKDALFSSRAPSKLSSSGYATGDRCAVPPDCDPIRPFSSPGRRSPTCIPTRCAASIPSTPSEICGWFFPQQIPDPRTHHCRTLSIVLAGAWSCFFVGSNSIFISKTFFGTSENAVNTQGYVAINVNVRVAVVKKHTKLELSV
jgi:hypothetical protein